MKHLKEVIITQKGAEYLKPVAAGARLIAQVLITLTLLAVAALPVSANAHDVRLCAQWPEKRLEDPLKQTNHGTELGMLNIRYIAKEGQENCHLNAGRPDSCAAVMMQFTRRYDVFPFPFGNRIDVVRVDRVGGLVQEDYCEQ